VTPEVATARGLSRRDVADRSGTELSFVEELIAHRLLSPDGGDRFTKGDVRRVGVIRSLLESGVPLEGLDAGIKAGVLSFAFLDSPEYDRFAVLTDETFEQVSGRTGIPVDLLTSIREAMGLGAAHPRDRIREDELAIVPFIELQAARGFRSAAIERLLRATGESLRKIAEAEAEWWRSEILTPRLEAGLAPEDIVDNAASLELTQRAEDALLAIYHAQEAQTWTANIVSGFEYQLEHAGLYRAPERPPAICFLDITGFTRLTQEQGDQAAAELARNLSRVVNRRSVEHGGRAVKWLGDGVMFWFREPGEAVLAALDMVVDLAAAALPPAHVGIHTGPVVLQDGDYYGQTVNLAARIADYARPGEVLISDAVAAVEAPEGITYAEIGAVELKGVSTVVALRIARRAG
jgi:adenylate cyclase